MRLSLGGVLGVLLLLACGFGPTSAVRDRQTVLLGDPAVAATPPASVSPPAGASGTALSAVVGSMFFVVAALLVVFLTASALEISLGRRPGSRWLRAPPIALA
jgi:hypothetical protein